MIGSSYHQRGPSRQAMLQGIIDKLDFANEDVGLTMCLGSKMQNVSLATHFKIPYATSLIRSLFDLQGFLNMLQNVQESAKIIYPGGTLFEYFVARDMFAEYIAYCKACRFQSVEVSDGILNISRDQKTDYIFTLVEEGFSVISEVGKKDSRFIYDGNYWVSNIWEDLEAGSELVILEARESGTSGYCQNDGRIDPQFITLLETRFGENVFARLMFEAPLRSQQVYLINRLGPAVNLGNIAEDDLLSLLSLRLGMRGDTLLHHIEHTEKIHGKAQ